MTKMIAISKLLSYAHLYQAFHLAGAYPGVVSDSFLAHSYLWGAALFLGRCFHTDEEIDSILFWRNRWNEIADGYH